MCDWNYRCKRCLRAVKTSPGVGTVRESIRAALAISSAESLADGGAGGGDAARAAIGTTAVSVNNRMPRLKWFIARR